MSYQRSEPRFAIEVPTTISVGDRQIKGAIKNISLNGLRTEVPLPIKTDEKIALKFSLPNSKDSFETFGNVRWCQKSHTSYLAGIKVEKPNDVALPIYLLSHEKQESNSTAILEEPALKKKSKMSSPLEEDQYQQLAPALPFPKNMFHELYLGLFFETFQRSIQKQLVRIACDLELAGFYLDKVTKASELSASIKHKLNEINKRMQFLQNAFNNQVHFLRLLNVGRIKPTNYELPEVIHVNELLTSRIHYFQELLSALMVPYSGEIIYQTEQMPPLLASQVYLAYGLDLLILFSYHTLSIASAKKIVIRGYFDPAAGIICEFKNNGSKLFKEDDLEVDCTMLQNHLQKCLGNRLYFWICYALSFFKDNNCKLSIHSESGNNKLILTFPGEKQ